MTAGQNADSCVSGRLVLRERLVLRRTLSLEGGSGDSRTEGHAPHAGVREGVAKDGTCVTPLSQRSRVRLAPEGGVTAHCLPRLSRCRLPPRSWRRRLLTTHR